MKRIGGSALAASVGDKYRLTFRASRGCIIELLSVATFSLSEHPLLRLGSILLLVGVTLSLTVIVWALRNAPEGYEDDKGFHSEQTKPSISHSAGVSMLHPHSAG
jgi:hypothetical protein